MIWIVSSNSNHCRIYSYQRKPLFLKLIKEIIHPEFRLKKREFLTTERPGHYQTSSAARGAYSPHTDPKDVKISKLSQEIARVVNQGKIKNLFKKFIIIAPPHVGGLILMHLDENVENFLLKNIKKDYLHVSDQDLLKYLQENIRNLGI